MLEAARGALQDARRGGAPPAALRAAFGDLVAAAAADAHHDARAVAPAAADDACLRDLQAAVADATPVFAAALRDPHPAVRMRAVRSVTATFRRVLGLAWATGIGEGASEGKGDGGNGEAGGSGIERSGRFPAEVFHAWIEMHLSVLSFLDDEHDGVANSSVKFADAAALALSYSGSGGAGSAEFFTLDYAYAQAANSPSVDVAKLQAYGKAIVSKLEAFVRRGAQDFAGNVIRVIPFTTAITALGNLARRRKLLMNLALPALLSVATEIVKEDGLPPAIALLSRGQRSSIIMVLRLSLRLLSTYNHASIGQVARDLAAACKELCAHESREYALVRRKHQAQKDAKRAAAAALAAGAPPVVARPVVKPAAVPGHGQATGLRGRVPPSGLLGQNTGPLNEKAPPPRHGLATAASQAPRPSANAAPQLSVSGLSQLLAHQRKAVSPIPPPPPPRRAGDIAPVDRKQSLPQRHAIPKRPRADSSAVAASRPTPETAAMGAWMLINTIPDRRQLVNFIVAKIQEGPPNMAELERREKRLRTSSPRGSPTDSDADDSRDPAPGEKSGEVSRRAPSRRAVVPAVVAPKLSDDARHRLLQMQCRRILKSEANAATSGAAPLRLLALSRLLTMATGDSVAGGKAFAKEVVMYLVADFPARIELALAWLHAEAACSFEIGGCCEVTGKSESDEREAMLVVDRLNSLSSAYVTKRSRPPTLAVEANRSYRIKDEPIVSEEAKATKTPTGHENKMDVDAMYVRNPDEVCERVNLDQKPKAQKAPPPEPTANGGHPDMNGDLMIGGKTTARMDRVEAQGTDAGDDLSGVSKPATDGGALDLKSGPKVVEAGGEHRAADSGLKTREMMKTRKAGEVNGAAIGEPTADANFVVSDATNCHLAVPRTEKLEAHGRENDAVCLNRPGESEAQHKLVGDVEMKDDGTEGAVRKKQNIEIRNQAVVGNGTSGQKRFGAEDKDSDCCDEMSAVANNPSSHSLVDEPAEAPHDDVITATVGDASMQRAQASIEDAKKAVGDVSSDLEMDASDDVVEGTVQLGSRYETLLNLILGLAAKELEPEDRLFSRLLVEAPSIPDSSLSLVFADCRDAARGRLGLTTLRDIVLERPGPDRSRSLAKLLEFTIDKDAVLRGPSIRLVVNKLYEDMSGPIPECVERFAIKSLSEAIEATEIAQSAALKPSCTDNGEQGSGLDAIDTSTLERNTWLFTDLCAKKESLLAEFVRAYAKAPTAARPIILARAKDVAGQLGPLSKELAALISGEVAPYNEHSRVVVDFAVAITAASMSRTAGLPPENLVNAVRTRYEKTKDARLLLTVLTGLHRNQLLSYLPVLVAMEGSAGDVSFQAMITKVMAARPQVLAPDDLLVELHMLPCTPKVCAALKTCFEMTGVFTQSVIATTLQKILETSFLPDLLMRTVLLSRRLYPSLEAYIRETVILGTHGAIRKRIWEKEVLWKGFVQYCATLDAQSLVMLVRLPEDKLVELLSDQAGLRGLVRNVLGDKRVRINRRDRSYLTVAQEKASV